MFLVSLFVNFIASAYVLYAIFQEEDIDSASVSMVLAFCVLLSNQFNLVITWLAKTELEMVSVERVRQYFKNETENVRHTPAENLKRCDEKDIKKNRICS